MSKCSKAILQFYARMNPQKVLAELLEENSDYWLALLQKYFTDDVITIIGSPSVELQVKMEKDEKNRIEEQIRDLGESGLAEKAKLLQEAMEFIERSPPEDALAAVPVSSWDRLHYQAISGWHSGETCPHFALEEMPLYTRVHSLTTNLVYISIILDTTSMEQSTRKWIPLQLNGLAECPVRRGDTLVPHEQVISTTEQLTVMFSNDIGFGKSGNFTVGQYGNFIQIETRCEPQDYEEVVNHLYEILYKAKITKERLLVFTQRMINDVAQVCRNGFKIVYDILRDSVYCKDSNVHWCSVLRLQTFLKELVEQLNAGGDTAEAAVNEAKKAYARLTENAWLHLAADFDRYKLSTEPWKRFARTNESVPSEPRLYWDAALLAGWGGGCVVGVGGVESSFAARLAPGPRGAALADHAPLLVALDYFTQLEGPIYELIYGGGLLYGYSVKPSPSEGCLVYSMYRTTNAFLAYIKTKAIFEVFLATGEFDAGLFAKAKSSALFEVVENEKCTANVVRESLRNFVGQATDTYNRDLICAIAAVTPAVAQAAAARWLPTLLDPKLGKLAIVCHPTKVKDMQAAFDKFNIKLDAYESVELSHFNK